MKKGGYQIIDLKDFKIDTGTSVTMKGIYNILKEVKKPLLISGINFRGTKQQEQFIVPTYRDTNYEIDIKVYETGYVCTATVSPDDLITFNVV